MKKLLVVVDYQNDFVSGSLGFEGAELLDERIAAKVEAFRAEGHDIIYTMDTHGPAYLEMQEGKKLPLFIAKTARKAGNFTEKPVKPARTQ